MDREAYFKELCIALVREGFTPQSEQDGLLPVGQQEVHEYEAFGGGSGRRLYCWLTSSSQSLQTNLRIILDSTEAYTCGTIPLLRKREKFFFRKSGRDNQFPTS